LIPGMKSYSLGSLCSELGIVNTDRHRAAGDARVTARLLEILIDLNSNAGLELFDDIRSRLKHIHPLLDPEDIRNLPEETGVYYFIDEHRNIIYIGKSKNIKSRIMTHLTNQSSRRAIELVQKTAEINFELTGSELIALLKESAEIKRHKPLYNRAQRRSLFRYGLYCFHDSSGYINFLLKRNDDDIKAPLLSFSSKKEAVSYLKTRIEKFELCEKLCGLYKSESSCFQYELMNCRGACIGKESVPDYNRRAQKLIDALTYENENLILVDSGRRIDEYSVVKIENGKYRGYGYVDASEPISDPEQVNDYIKKYPDNHDIQSILRSYLKKRKVLKIIHF
jgi:DNA polymerase-3 subunit epsilon